MKRHIFSLLLLVSIFTFSCKEKNKAEFACDEESEYPLIEDSVAGRVQWAISNWLEYYKINIHKFKLVSSEEINIPHLKANAKSYFRKYTPRDDAFLPEVRDYSPDNRYYLNLLEAANVKLDYNGNWCMMDDAFDSQYVFLFDKQDSTLMLVAMHDPDNYSDAVFWVDNTTFVISGRRFLRKADNNRFYFNIYSLEDGVKDSYCLKDSSLMNDKNSYFKQVNLKKRGVIFN